MQRFVGIGASEGLVYGRARLLTPQLAVADRSVAAGEVAGELRRLEAALEAADEQLLRVSRQLQAETEGHAIIEVHRLILRSDEIMQEARKLVSGQRLAAETAVRRVVDHLVTRFDEMDDAYLRERGGDVEAVGERLVRTIVGAPESGWSGGSGSGAIGIGTTLSAVDAFRVREAGLIGLVTERGGRTSHLAIVLRDLEIPYVAGAQNLIQALRPGATLVVDGSRGLVVLDPDGETVATLREQRRRLESARRVRTVGPGPAATLDGARVEVAANVDALSEVARAVDAGAESLGLLRTELLYLDRPDLPGEEEQYRDAVSVLKALGGRAATFRTLDLGGDKLPLAVPVPSGANPSLGVRAIRFSARRPDIFRTQLRALYRASAAGSLRIMFPMISGVAEMHEARAVAQEVRAELDRERLPYDPGVALGAMIETPSAALTVDHLAGLCDFFSIGTNDLIQYTLAADRENEDVEYLYRPLHPAVLRLLKQVVDAAAAAGKPVSLCGDMGGEPLFTWVLLGLGVRALSMAPRRIPAVKAVIAGTRLSEAEDLVSAALQLRSPEAIEELVTRTMQRRFPDEFEQAA